MKIISLKIEDSIFAEAEGIIASMKKSRNRYINDAIEYYNAAQKRKILKQKLQKESLLVKEDSMSILQEFEGIGYDSKTIRNLDC